MRYLGGHRARVVCWALPLLLGAGCAEDITTHPGPGPLTMAVFDFSTPTPQVPFPTDLLMDPTTGLITYPPADAKTRPAQAYLDAFLNTLNGWPAMIPGEVHFSGALDQAQVNNKNIVVVEMDPQDPTKLSLVTGLSYEYKTESSGSWVRIYPAGGSWKRGARYVVYVVGGANGLRAAGGKQVYRSAYFELAAGAAPLCAWDSSKSWDATAMTCATPAPGAKATGCCTFNYNGLLESAVGQQVREANKGKSLEEVEKLAKQTVLQTVTRFELMRLGFNQLLALAAKLKIAQSDVAVLWSFKILDMNEAIFNPTTTPPQGPFPTDMVKDPKTGLLALPVAPNASKAEQALFAYLNSLDGFPTSFTGTVDFTGALDNASTGKGALVFTLDRSTPPKAAKLDKVAVTYNDAKNELVVGRQGGLKHATTHVMVAVAGASGLKNKDATFAPSPIRTVFMHLALSPHPLCDKYDATTRTCGGDPTVNVFLDDPAFVPGGLTARQKAALFEGVRLGYDLLLKAITAADSSPKGDDVRALWAFTTTTRTMVNIDPGNGALPFPSDLMLDAKTGKVSIPATPGETPADKGLREGLNSLDGFTTQGTCFVPLGGKVDPASITAPNAVLTLDVTAAIPAPAALTPAVDNTAGAITFKPAAPLNEKSRYAVVLTSKQKAGTLASQGGLKDDKGNYVIPSPFTVLLRGVDPVYDAVTKKSLVSILDDATAAQVEDGRLQAKPTFDGLAFLGVQRQDVVGAWTMTTMSITAEMMQLRALPYKALSAVDQNSPKLTGALDKTLASWPTTYMDTPKTGVGGIVSGTYKSWWALDATTGTFLDPTKGSAVDVPFLLAVPSGTAPVTGWPVVIYLHGVFNSKAEALALASANAQKGLATLGFDLPFHGARSACTKADECDGGTCTAGKCSTKLADKDKNGIEDVSGVAFLNLQNPFALRDNLRQAVIDGSALLRTVVLGGESGITGGPVSLDPAKVTIAGDSTGAIVAAVWLAVEGNTVRGALTSPSLRLAEILLAPGGGKSWASMRQAVLQAQGISDGTLEALRLVTTFTWILERADAGNFGRFIKKALLDDLTKPPGTKVPAKAVILQQAEKDESMPVLFSAPLATEIGADTTDTLYLGQQQGFFGVAAPDLTATQACRIQVATFLGAGTVCKPAVSGGKYTGQCN